MSKKELEKKNLEGTKKEEPVIISSKETATKKEEEKVERISKVKELFSSALKLIGNLGSGLDVNVTTKYTAFLLKDTKKIIASIRELKNGIEVGAHIFNSSGKLVRHEHLAVFIGSNSTVNLKETIKVISSNLSKVVESRKKEAAPKKETTVSKEEVTAKK